MSCYTNAEVEGMLTTGGFEGRLTRDDIPTPALLLDLDAFEFNVAKMAEHCRAHAVSLRPHAKTHKCPEVARALIEAGAVGACAAKLSEAEVFAGYGITGLLITTPVVGRHKIGRAVSLALRQTDTLFLVDHPRNVEDLNAAAGAASARLNVVIDLHVGRKGGVMPGAPAVDLARLIAASPNLRLAGLQAYAGYVAHCRGYVERKRLSGEALAPAIETRRLLERDGLECGLMTGGSTGTYDIDCGSAGLTELQPGSFIFMDIDYNRIGGRDEEEYRDFRTALTVLTTVVSRPLRHLAIVDGGYKAFATDKPYTPEALGLPGATYTWGGDEHGKIDLSRTEGDVELGDRLEFTVPHCDPTVNLYDRIYCMRNGSVQAVWKIAARGMSQ